MYNIISKGGYILNIINIIKGALIGIANIIPGLSGGTLAVVMNIYDKLIESIGSFFTSPIRTIKDIWPYLVGIALGLLVGIFGISYLLERFEIQTSALFVGLVIGAIPLIFKQVNKSSIKASNIVVLILMILIVISLPFLSTLGFNSSSSNPLIYFFIGTVAAATMVIPGVSGSMVLMAVGYYEVVVNLVKDTLSALASFDTSVLFPNLGLLIPMGLGILIGIILIAKLITWLFSEHKQMTTFGILGLIIASPIVVFIELNYANVAVSTVIVSIITFFIGYFISTFLNKLEK